MAGPAASDVLGRVTLVTGPEEFLGERTIVRRARPRCGATTREAELSETMAGSLTMAELGELACAVAVLDDALRRRPPAGGPAGGVASRPRSTTPQAPAEDVALVLVHGGGPEGQRRAHQAAQAAGRDRGEVACR